MHCVLNYPCPPENANISFINTLFQKFKSESISIGYSCHVPMPFAIDVNIAALTLGASVIEKHYTTSRIKSEMIITTR